LKYGWPNCKKEYEKLLSKKNRPVTKNYNGIYYRCKRPVLTAAPHAAALAFTI
jgi:hypothetical protein